MKVRILGDNEKNRIRPLYEEVFDDSEYFLNYYFDSYIKTSINFVCEIGDEIVGMATIHPKELMISNKRVRAGYVFAVATSPTHRGKGIMTLILEKIYDYAMDNNYEYLYLIPVNPKIYEGLDYKLLREKKEICIEKSSTDEASLNGKTVFKVNYKNVDKCIEFISGFYENKVSLHYNENYLYEIINRLSINNSGIYCIFDEICDRILGLVFVEDDEGIIVDDLICSADYENACMEMVMYKLNAEKITYKIHDIMFKEVHGRISELNNYSICINDEI